MDGAKTSFGQRESNGKAVSVAGMVDEIGTSEQVAALPPHWYMYRIDPDAEIEVGQLHPRLTDLKHNLRLDAQSKSTVSVLGKTEDFHGHHRRTYAERHNAWFVHRRSD